MKTNFSFSKLNILLTWFTGEQATRMVVAEGRRVADSCRGPQRSELLRLCDETEILTSQLSDLIKKGQVWDGIKIAV